MARNMTTGLSWGRSRTPKAWSSPMMTLARKAPVMLPMPPITTTTKAAAIVLVSISRLAPPFGSWMAPARPARKEPRKKTELNSQAWLTPSAPTISRSAVAARTRMPQRVRRRTSQSRSSTSGAAPISTRS